MIPLTKKSMKPRRTPELISFCAFLNGNEALSEAKKKLPIAEAEKPLSAAKSKRT